MIRCSLRVSVASVVLYSFLFLSGVEISQAGGASWPIFRGSQALTGVAKGKLPDKPQLLWSTKIGNAVKSSPVIGNGLVFIASTDGKICALRLADGTNVWEFNTGRGISAPPLLLDNSVYVGSGVGMFYSVDAASGKSNWTYETKGEIAGSANWIKAPDGKGKWILVGSYDNIMHCVDSVTGKQIWTFRTGNFINGSPAVDDGKVAFGGCDAQIRFLSAADGVQITNVSVGAYVAASPALDDGFAFAGDYGNSVVCINIAESKIAWEYGQSHQLPPGQLPMPPPPGQPQGAPFFSSPAVGKDRIVIGCRDNKLHCMGRKDGKKIWTFTTKGAVDSCPVICRDKVVVGSCDGRIYMVKLSDGTEIWSYEVGAPLTSSPAVVDGMIVIGCEDGKVYAFGKK
jgi:eukaryotic-like serine/threonine-protein kinase